MKFGILPMLLILTAPMAFAQTVISTTGQSYETSSLIVSQTVGEAVIGTVTNGISVEQGFHHPHMLITTISMEEESLIARVYPNPFSDQVRIEGSAAIGLVEMFDMGGKLVWSLDPAGKEQTVVVDLSSSQPGQYLLRVNTHEAGTVNTYQLIKQ